MEHQVIFSVVLPQSEQTYTTTNAILVLCLCNYGRFVYHLPMHDRLQVFGRATENR